MEASGNPQQRNPYIVLVFCIILAICVLLLFVLWPPNITGTCLNVSRECSFINEHLISDINLQRLYIVEYFNVSPGRDFTRKMLSDNDIAFAHRLDKLYGGKVKDVITSLMSEKMDIFIEFYHNMLINIRPSNGRDFVDVGGISWFGYPPKDNTPIRSDPTLSAGKYVESYGNILDSAKSIPKDGESSINEGDDLFLLRAKERLKEINKSLSGYFLPPQITTAGGWNVNRKNPPGGKSHRPTSIMEYKTARRNSTKSREYSLAIASLNDSLNKRDENLYVYAVNVAQKRYDEGSETQSFVLNSSAKNVASIPYNSCLNYYN